MRSSVRLAVGLAHAVLSAAVPLAASAFAVGAFMSMGMLSAVCMRLPMAYMPMGSAVFFFFFAHLALSSSFPWVRCCIAS
jgi:hypothetical protein